MGTVSPNSNPSTAKRLQEATDELGQLRHELARLLEVDAENTRLREEIARVKQPTEPLYMEIKAQRNRAIVAEERAATLDRRVTEQQREIRRYEQRLNDVLDLIRDKECLLPQIRSMLLGG